MLKLIFNTKCGYENNYITINNYELDISFLAKRSYYNKLALLTNKKAVDYVPTEKELFEEFKDKPEKLLKDYGLSTLLLSMVVSEIATKHFPETIDETISPIIFPELFTARNFKLALTQNISPEESVDKVLQEMLDSSAEPDTNEDSASDDSVNHFDA